MSLLGSWFRGQKPSDKVGAPGTPSRAKRRGLPLSLEALEGRNLPSAMFSTPAAAVPPQDLALANKYVKDVAVRGASNEYGLPASITYVHGVIHARTECAQLVRLVLENTYASVTGSVLKSLTGSTQPNSARFHDAIVAQSTYVQGNNTFAFHARPQVSAIQPGDILAAPYHTRHGSGHTMLVNAITLAGSQLTGIFPGMEVNEYRVQVIDSASGPHTGAPSFPDSRGRHGEGIGSGYILLYENAQTGALVGWAWTTRQRTPYQSTDPAGAQYRPLVAGYLTGPGIQ